jgi:hypothetical protein
VAVFQVVSHGDEHLAQLRSQAEDPVCTTRLVVADDDLAGEGPERRWWGAVGLSGGGARRERMLPCNG